MACLRMTKTCQGPHGKPKDGIRQLSGRMDLCVASSREHDKRKNARQHIKACILPATRHPKTLTTNSAGIHRLRSAFDNRNAQDRYRETHPTVVGACSGIQILSRLVRQGPKPLLRVERSRGRRKFLSLGRIGCSRVMQSA